MSHKVQEPAIKFCSTKWLADTWISVLHLAGCRPVNLQLEGFSTWIITDDQGRMLRDDMEVV